MKLCPRCHDSGWVPIPGGLEQCGCDHNARLIELVQRAHDLATSVIHGDELPPIDRPDLLAERVARLRR